MPISWGKTTLALVAASLILSGCAGMGLDKARKVSPAGTPFAQSLYDGYLKLSETEYAEYDWADSDLFAEKAIATTGPDMVLPEAISARDLPDDKVGDLTAARSRLVTALDASARKKVAGDAAHAQVMFDCWMQEQEENFQPEDIAACRGEFESAMAKVDAAMKPKPAAKPAPKPAPAPAPKKAAAPPKPKPRTFVVYFDFDKADVSAAEMAQIAAAVTYYKQIGKAKIMLTSHADRAGTDEHNQKLSELRGETVAFALMDSGVVANDIKMKAMGETQPAIPTSDGVREPGNRRAELVVQAR